VTKTFTRTLLASGLLAFASTAFAGPIVVTQTTNSATLSAALQGAGLVVNSATVANGAVTQFGTYTNMNTAPVIFGDGVVLSTGLVSDTPGPPNAANIPSTVLGSGGTAEFDAYGPGRIANFADSNDVASLLVTFTLAAPSAIAFDFVFGSIEYPDFTNSFTDAFLAFLDGTGVANQITFDASNNPVQVGTTFASALVTTDVDTAFGAGHGLLGPLTTTTAILPAGAHTLRFEIGDVNDGQLDSGVFIRNLRTTTGNPGTNPGVPEPSSMLLLGFGLAAGARRLMKNRK
jgi:hypothetical protein